MAEWSKNRVDSSSINNGKEFTIDDNLSVAELNAIVNNSFYGVDFVEAMADEPDISDIDNASLAPSVSIIDNEKDGKPFKKFKFTALRGAMGNGVYYSSEEAQNSTTLIPIESVTNLSNNVIDAGDMILTANSKVFIVTSTWSNMYVVNFATDIKGLQGEQGKVGATFTYDQSTKTLNIITE